MKAVRASTASCFLTTTWTLPLVVVALLVVVVSGGFLPSPQSYNPRHNAIRSDISLKGSFFDDLFGVTKNEPATSTVGNEGQEEGVLSLPEEETAAISKGQPRPVVNEDDLTVAAFQQAQRQMEAGSSSSNNNDDDDEEFDGYIMRDIIVEKWGHAFDLEFQRVEAMGLKEIYLNVMPFRLGSRSFRHETELDYLCHLQAIVEILHKYNQIGNILYQIDATNKKPRAGTSPLVAVPLRLDLTEEQVDKILGP